MPASGIWVPACKKTTANDVLPKQSGRNCYDERHEKFAWFHSNGKIRIDFIQMNDVDRNELWNSSGVTQTPVANALGLETSPPATMPALAAPLAQSASNQPVNAAYRPLSDTPSKANP